MKTLGTLIGMALLAALLTFLAYGIYTYVQSEQDRQVAAQQSPLATPTPSATDQSAALGVHAAAADPTAIATEAAIATPPAAAAAVTQDVPVVNNSQVVALLAEVDSIHKMSRVGASYHDFRYEVISGNMAVSSLWATESGTLTDMRIACDDICDQIVLVRGNIVTDLSGEFQILVPAAANAEPYGSRAVAFASVKNWDTMLGASPSDILTQWVGKGLNINLTVGDQIIIVSRDDAEKQVNTGVFASWIWNQAK